MVTEPLITAEDVSKKFCRTLKRSLWYGMTDLRAELSGHANAFNGHLRKDEFWALKGVSFELRRGECLGLIGRNGAGKTTLLRMLNGLIKPNQGQITVHGTVAALISLGAGFNPILTGRENIYINGAVLGLSKKDIDAKIDHIIDFADIGDFIDSPVQNYSAGMQVRLGFSVATTLEPDVLLLDEVLAVGDAAFRNKCYNKIGQLKRTSAIILVSHNMDQVGQFCDRAMVLSSSHKVYDGNVVEGIKTYERLQQKKDGFDDAAFESLLPPVTDVSVELTPQEVPHGEHVQFKMKVHSERTVSDIILKIVLYDEQHIPCAEWNSDRNGLPLSLTAGVNTFQVDLGPMILKAGRYRLGIVLTDEGRITMLVWSYKVYDIHVVGFSALGPRVAFRSDLIQPGEHVR